MKAVIYSRKSNDDDRSEENRRITRHRERATAWAESQGWTVDPKHVYEDDGISGAEFDSRPGLLRMLGAHPAEAEALRCHRDERAVPPRP